MALRNIPIRLKLMLIILLTSVTVMTLMGGAFLINEYLSMRRIMVRQLTILGQVLTSNSTAALAFENRDDAREILQALKAEQHVTIVCSHRIPTAPPRKACRPLPARWVCVSKDHS
jgi:sensor histidine kinase regulating citrate/malate metabolism